MRISDWSSDVCSSDLDILTNFAEAQRNPCHCREELAAPAGRRHAKRLLPRFETLAFILVSRLPIEHASTARRRSLLCQSNVRECEKRSEEHTSELQSLMRISYAVFCLKKKKNIRRKHK